MPRRLGNIRKRAEVSGGSSNVEKLADEFNKQIHFGKEDDKMDEMTPSSIKKKFSI